MSFSSECKNELCRTAYSNRCCELAEMSAVIRTTGAIHINRGKLSLSMNLENAGIAKRVYSMLKKLFGISGELNVKKNRYFNRQNIYILSIGQDMGLMDILFETKIIQNKDSFTFTNYIDKKLIESECCKRAYLKGAFLGSASISDPEKTYHLEFVSDSIEFAKDLEGLINYFDLNAKIVERKNNFVVYLKEGEHIIDLLNIIGAHTSLLELENIRILKEMRNNVNRVVNCETSNLRKTIDASVRQINNIKYIQEQMGLNKLPSSLQELAELRLEFPDASLKELGEMLPNPVGKSGVNHRLRKLDEIAEGLKGSVIGYERNKDNSEKSGRY